MSLEEVIIGMTVGSFKLTDTVHAPEFDGWKNDSVLVISLSNVSRAFEPPAKPVVVGGVRASGAAVTMRAGPSTDTENTRILARESGEVSAKWFVRTGLHTVTIDYFLYPIAMFIA